MSLDNKTSSQIQIEKDANDVTADVARIADQIEQKELEVEQKLKDKQLETDAVEPKLYFRTCFGGISK